jgi:hypothetical protein
MASNGITIATAFSLHRRFCSAPGAAMVSTARARRNPFSSWAEANPKGAGELMRDRLPEPDLDTTHGLVNIHP